MIGGIRRSWRRKPVDGGLCDVKGLVPSEEASTVERRTELAVPGIAASRCVLNEEASVHEDKEDHDGDRHDEEEECHKNDVKSGHTFRKGLENLSEMAT